MLATRAETLARQRQASLRQFVTPIRARATTGRPMTRTSNHVFPAFAVAHETSTRSPTYDGNRGTPAGVSSW